METAVIEFQGAYFRKSKCNPQAVLVQFDGVLLHVWHLSDPFHRLLTSDVFHLPKVFGRRRQHIKLPNGGRIETEDMSALGRLQNFSKKPLTSADKKSVVTMVVIIVALLILMAIAPIVIQLS